MPSLRENTNIQIASNITIVTRQNLMVMIDNPPEEKAKVGTLRMPVDPIHGGLRAAVFGSFIGTGVVGFGAGLLFFPNAVLISLLLSGVAATGTSMGLERYLKSRWPSGREFVADAERIALIKQGKIESVVDAQQQVNVLTWRFEAKKDGPRAKKGWHILCLGLEQDDNYVIVYTTASPDEFEDMPFASAFTKLEKKRSEKESLSSARTMRQAGEQRRLHEAEVVRQLVGGDLFFDQFVETLLFLEANYPRWMISD